MFCHKISECDFHMKQLRSKQNKNFRKK